MDINTGINQYLLTKNYRTGFSGNASELLSSRSNIKAELNVKPNENEAVSDEGKTDSETTLPPPNDVGKLMDFKV